MAAEYLKREYSQEFAQMGLDHLRNSRYPLSVSTDSVATLFRLPKSYCQSLYYLPGDLNLAQNR